MSNTNILQLPIAIGLDGTEYAPIVQGGTTKRVTTALIGGLASGFLPTSTVLNTGPGLAGGGLLSSGLTLYLDVNDLSANPSMAVDDSFAINYVAGSNTSQKVTFPNAMKAIAGMTALSIPNLVADGIPIYHAADGLTYKVSPSALGLATGNVPAGGTTSQFLAKASDTNYDTEWVNASITLNAYSIAANTTGSTALGTSLSGSAYQILRLGAGGTSLAFGSIDLSQSAAVGSSILPLANGGTNAALTASNGGIFYSTASAAAILSGTATASQALLSGTSAAPSWSTSTYPSTSGAGTVLASGAANTITATIAPTLGIQQSSQGQIIFANTAVGAFATTLQSSNSASAAWTLTLPVSAGTSGYVLTTNGSGVSSWAPASGAAVNLVVGSTTVASGTNTRVLYDNSGVLGEYAQIPLAVGGTNANLTASIGGIVYSTASALDILSGTATAGQIVRSGASSAPSWSTSTYPATSAAGTILASGTANTITATATPTLGIAGTTLGTLALTGNTSGTVLITPQATAGSPTLTLPDASGTFAVSASSPLALSATTGNLTVTGSALTKTDDTNVTLALGGSPSTALLAAASLTLGWTGTLSEARGGTAQSTYALGDTLYASAANTLSKLSGNTTAVKQYLSQTGTGAVSAAPAWATISGGDITGAALTNGDDTNVTLTLGGTPATSLLRATSITAGWTGQLSLARGGTNANLTASDGGIFYSTASAGAILSGTATASLPLLSGSSTTPSWAVISYPTSATSGGIPYFSSTSAITSSALLVANQLVLGGGAATAPATLGSLGTTTTVLHGNAAGAPTFGAVVLTTDVSGVLPLANGGSNANLTASNGGIVYSTASAFGILAGTATANQVLLSGLSTTPAWSTATYPATTTINQLLYSSSANVIAGLATANGGVLNASATGVPSLTITPTLGVQQTSQGQLVLANTAAGAFPATIQSSNSATAATTLTLPPDAGTGGYVLSTNGSGATSWISVGGVGTVTSVDVSGGTTGLTFSGGPIVGAGTITMAGTLNVADGGTGLTTLTSNVIYKGNGTSALAASGLTDNGTTISTSENFSVGTSASITTGTIELGAASDTTISRSAAGVIAVEGVPIYSGIPINSQSTAYSTVLADAQKCILHPTADNNARTFTIDGSVSYPIGSVITFTNQINTVTIAITTDTMTLAAAGTTGSRTLAANGIATAFKIASGNWIISGVGLT